MTDEETIYIHTEELKHYSSLEFTGSSISIGCDSDTLTAWLKSNESVPRHLKPQTVKIRFDQQKPFTLKPARIDKIDNDEWGAKVKATITNNTHITLILNGLKTAQQRLIYQISDGTAHVIPLAVNDTYARGSVHREIDKSRYPSNQSAIKHFEENCPQYP